MGIIQYNCKSQNETKNNNNKTNNKLNALEIIYFTTYRLSCWHLLYLFSFLFFWLSFYCSARLILAIVEFRQEASFQTASQCKTDRKRRNRSNIYLFLCSNGPLNLQDILYYWYEVDLNLKKARKMLPVWKRPFLQFRTKRKQMQKCTNALHTEHEKRIKT